MAGTLADKLEIQGIMDSPGTKFVGRYQLLRSGNGVGGTIPKEHARVLGALEAGETDVYVNYEHGLAIHKIPEEPEERD